MSERFKKQTLGPNDFLLGFQDIRNFPKSLDNETLSQILKLGSVAMPLRKGIDDPPPVRNLHVKLLKLLITVMRSNLSRKNLLKPDIVT